MFEGRMIDGKVDLNAVAMELMARTAGEGGGALVAFVGFVKGLVEGERVRSLNYEAYEPYASRILDEIAKGYRGRPGVLGVVILHRRGELAPGEPTVYILVAAKDRKTAFAVASEVLERVKREPPIFKLEKREDGEYWIVGDGIRLKRAR
ncbi:molybdenum cofactor biosynthesis protein MoaD [Candidatus Geothermarchaeota archaeon ex4572_27]|nr:MAG: molybdenum cofactor biosynthesis protein MoaD [Candidatus Geothermarchaeota archaeon ex4572_27]